MTATLPQSFEEIFILGEKENAGGFRESSALLASPGHAEEECCSCFLRRAQL